MAEKAASKKKEKELCDAPQLTGIGGLITDFLDELADKAGSPEQGKLCRKLWANWRQSMTEEPLCQAIPLGHKNRELIIGAEDSGVMQNLMAFRKEILEIANELLEEPFFSSCRFELVEGRADLSAPVEEAKGETAKESLMKTFPKLTGSAYFYMDPDSPVTMCYKRFIAKNNGMSLEEVDAMLAEMPRPTDEELAEAKTPPPAPRPSAVQVKLTGEYLKDMDPNSAITRCYRQYVLRSGTVLDETAIKKGQEETLRKKREAYFAGIKAQPRADIGSGAGLSPSASSEFSGEAERKSSDKDFVELTGEYLNEMDPTDPATRCYRAFVEASRKRRQQEHG